MRCGYEALTAKVKAMYSRRLKYADYVRMAHMGSVDEVLDDLRRHPVWGAAAARLTEGSSFGRSVLESALREQLREEYLRVLSFVPRSDRALMEFPVLRSELDGLLFTLSRLRAGHALRPEPLPDTFIRHSKTVEEELYVCTDYQGLLDSTRESIYYPPLYRLRTPDGSLPDFARTESALFTVYYDHMLQVISQRYRGDVRVTLEHNVGVQVDMLNIMHILRLKRFFPEERGFMDVLYPIRYKLGRDQVEQMCAAPGPDEVLELVSRTPYAKTFRGAEVAELDRLFDRTLFGLSRRQLMLGAPSIYSAVAFLNLRTLELEALTGVVETVKYQADYDDSFVKLLGQ